MSDVNVSARVTVPTGWIDLMADPYRLTADAFVESATTWRRADVASPFVEGSWTVAAVREQVQETVDIWVRESDAKRLREAINRLLEAFSQLRFGLEVGVDGVTTYYQCSVADTVVKTSVPLRAATMAQVTAVVPRYPISYPGKV